MSDNLLPCPFCGSKAEYLIKQALDEKNVYWFDVKCTSDGCYLEDGADWYFDDKETAAIMWNRRTNVS